MIKILQFRFKYTFSFYFNPNTYEIIKDLIFLKCHFKQFVKDIQSFN